MCARDEMVETVRNVWSSLNTNGEKKKQILREKIKHFFFLWKYLSVYIDFDKRIYAHTSTYTANDILIYYERKNSTLFMRVTTKFQQINGNNKSTWFVCCCFFFIFFIVLFCSERFVCFFRTVSVDPIPILIIIRSSI